MVGFLRGTMSFGWTARQILDVARSAGLTAFGLDIAKAFAAEHLSASSQSATAPPPAIIEGGATLIVCVNPDQFQYAAAFLPPTAFQRKYVIAHCVWELEKIPHEWLAALAAVDEIWVPSQFVRQAFADAGLKLPCRIVPPQLEEPPAASADRRRFGIAPDAFAVLLAFGFGSSVVRKNPMAAVRAFKKAFPTERDVCLVLKISDIETNAEAWNAFRRAAGDDDPRFVFITDRLTDAEMWSLYASIDVALSTHRAEGYGMIPALAMLSGRAAIATGWSAVLDFMTAENSILLPYKLVAVEDAEKRYVIEGTRWAEVDEDAAAAAMQRLYADRDLRNRLALAGKHSIEAYLKQHRDELVGYMRTWQPSKDASGRRNLVLS